jgi:tRNA G18 (ribose-2'-O)-methylase SpoU
VVDALTHERLPFSATHLSSPYDGIRPMPVSVLLDNVRSLYNVGSFFRTADACALEKLYLGGITGFPPQRQITKTALGAEDRVPWEHRWSSQEIAEDLHRRGLQLAAIETSVRSVDLFDWQPCFPVCVVFGHEVEGMQPAIAERCDVHVRIPMLGSKHSLNVATAGGVVLYELLRKYRALAAPVR